MEPNLLLRTGTLSTEWIIFDIISIPKDFPKIFKNPESFLKFFSSISGDFPNIFRKSPKIPTPPPHKKNSNVIKSFLKAFWRVLVRSNISQVSNSRGSSTKATTQSVINNLPNTTVFAQHVTFSHPRKIAIKNSIVCITSWFSPAECVLFVLVKLAFVALLSGIFQSYMYFQFWSGE